MFVRILGIESSCDETAAAVVEDGDACFRRWSLRRWPRMASTAAWFRNWLARAPARHRAGGAARRWSVAHTALEDLAAIAVTVGPGLVGSLLVGTHLRQVAELRPRRAADRRESHRGPYSCGLLEARRDGTPVEFPALALVVSGGHTHLFEVREGFHYRLLGKTRDDAAGEAFDKVAKLLGFGYPGGPVIDRLAPPWQSARRALHPRQNERQRARFQLQRTEDRGAALGGSARHGGGDRRPASAAARATATRRRGMAGGDAASIRSTCWLRFSTP